MDEQNDLMDNEDELNDLEESEPATDGADDAPPATDNDGSEAESKRVSDLTSKWQKEQARANRLQAELDGKKTQRGKAKNNEQDEFMDFAREQARNTLFASDPRFNKYGLKPEVITGQTPEEMRKSFDSYKGLLDSLQSRIRNEVLAEHGIAADVSDGGAPKGLPDFNSMSDEDFRKLMERRSAF